MILFEEIFNASPDKNITIIREKEEKREIGRARERQIKV